MAETPSLDGRTREEIRAHLLEIAPYYVDGWDPERSDSGMAVLEIFAEMTEEIVERLDRIPEKQRATFLQSLGFDVHPPHPSKLPVTFRVDDDVAENVPIPPRTVTAAPATDDRGEQRFETGGERTFEATPATLLDAVGVDPGTDRIVDHGPALDAGEPTPLFTGSNVQAHEYYLGHEALLTLNPGATIEVELETNAPETAFRDYLVWEYYGENADGEEGWHAVDVVDRRELAIASLSAFQQVESFVERIDRFLADYDYEMISDDDAYSTLIRAICDDVRKGRFAGPDEDGEGETATLPWNLLDPHELDPRAIELIVRQLPALRRRLEGAAGSRFGRSVDSLSLTLRVPGEPTELEIDGVESRWLRCRIPEDELAPSLFETVVASARLSVGSGVESAGSLGLDAAVANDVPIDPDGDGTILPLGANPAAGSTFSLACEEAFVKPGAAVTLRFESDEGDDPPEGIDPDLVWEYWDGDGWRRLPVVDETAQLRTSGSVSFEVPTDLDTTSVLGDDRRWIRARLVDGNYGELRIEERDAGSWERVTDHLSPPAYDRVRVDYSRTSVPFRRQRASNNCSYRDVAAAPTAYRPFDGIGGTNQTLYLGFDRPLRGGPINLYLPMDQAEYPYDFDPWIDVEYCTDPSKDEWERLDLADGTDDLTREGILGVSLSEPTTSFERFGRERHWIRIVLTGDEFSRGADRLFVPSERRRVSSAHLRELSTEPIAGRERRQRTRTPPVLTGIHPNTVWATNVESIEDASLGSSRGTANQAFSFARRPVLEADVRIDEREALSDRERRALEADESTDVEVERAADGSVASVWVGWTEVTDFLASDPDSRHYVLDRTAGTVTFGDGRRGRIPPVGRDNVVADYRTGGGDDGDVSVGAVSSVRDELPYVESVTNPGPGETGESSESIEEFVSRAPRRLRDRGKPITRDGFERIALSATREVRKVRCLAGEDETGAVGQVTLVVVPDEPRKPVPSESLLRSVEREMRSTAPEAVVGDETALIVRGPHFVDVSIDAAVESTGSRSVTEVREVAESALSAFVHPLTGGPDGEGWEIGTAPPPSTFLARLERLEEVARVTNIAVTFTDRKNEVTLADESGPPIVPPDVLIRNGRHDVTVDPGGSNQ